MNRMIKALNYKNTRLGSSLLHSVLIVTLTISFSSISESEPLTHPLFSPEPIDIKNEKTPLNPKGCTMESMVQFYRKELDIKHANITFVRRRMQEPNTRGYTQPKGGHKYLITLAKGLEPSELRITVAHELVHVRQLEQGSIKKEEFNKDYLERNFEDEAFRLSLPMAAKFYQTVNCQPETTEAPRRP